MRLFNTYKEIVEQELKRSIPKEMTFEFLEFYGKPNLFDHDVKALNRAIIEPLWDFLNRGGKRWRPILMLLANQAVGSDPNTIKELTPIPELLHNGTLMVDDIEDSSPLRRGKRALHIMYGTDISINLGNYLYYLPHKIIRQSSITNKKKRIITDLINYEMARLHLGQAMDIHWHNQEDHTITEEQYLKMCSLKTGTLARLSIKLGAILGNASKPQIDALSRFAESVGVAFQIQDDILNIVGSAQWGKETGEDIRENKKTLILLHFMDNAPLIDKKKILDLLGKKPSKKDMALVLSLLNRYGSIEYAKGKAKELVLKSKKDLDKVIPPSEAKREIMLLADYLINRSF